MKKLNIGVIDYGMGNLHSVAKALAVRGDKVIVSDQRARLKSADLLVLPGVGAFGAAMTMLAKKKLDDFIRSWIEADRPYLGICLGFQLLFDRSEESRDLEGLGVFSGPVIKFNGPALKKKKLQIPHMGWNNAVPKGKSLNGYFKGINKDDYFYFVHSYYPVPTDAQLGGTETFYGAKFCSAVSRGSLFASQFHPEKSGNVGLQLVKNILAQAAQ